MPKARLSPEVVSAIAVPLVETLQSMPEIPFTMGIGAGDPALDSDPFFLRSQSWAKGSIGLEGNGVAFRRDGNRLEIGLPSQENVWTLNAPLRPAYADDTWVYLVANDEALFEKKNPNDGPGQGVFLSLGGRAACRLQRSAEHGRVLPPASGRRVDRQGRVQRGSAHGHRAHHRSRRRHVTVPL